MTKVLHMHMRLLLAVTAVTSMLATGAVGQTAPTSQPAAIMCYVQADQSWLVIYLYRVKKNGDAIYTLPYGMLSATVNAKGVMVAPTNKPAGHDCFGKTLDELRSSGRLMEFQPTK